MDIFTARQELEEQFERQRGRAWPYYLDRYEDADLSRARLLLGQMRVRGERAIWTSDLKKAATKKKSKAKKVSKVLKGEKKWIEDQQKISERGQRRRPGEERIQVVGQPYVNPAGAVAEDPEITRARMRQQDQHHQNLIVERQADRAARGARENQEILEAQAQRADAYRIHQDRQAIEGQRMFADVMIAHGAQAAARDVAGAQAHGQQQVAAEQRRQAGDVAQIAADRDVARFNANLVERRDNLVGDRARQAAELQQLQERIGQENRERDAERVQAIELTAREFQDRARQHEGELRARGLDADTEQIRIREAAQTDRERDANQHRREEAVIQGQRAQAAERDARTEQLIHEMQAQNRQLTEHILNLHEPIPEMQGMAPADREFIERTLHWAGQAVDRRIGESEERMRDEMRQHFDRTGAPPARQEQVEEQLPHDLRPLPVGGGQHNELGRTSLRQSRTPQQVRDAEEEAERLLLEEAGGQAPLSVPLLPYHTPEPDQPAHQDIALSPTPPADAPRERQWGDPPTPPATPRASPRLSPLPPVIQTRPQTGSAEEELARLLEVPSPLAARQPQPTVRETQQALQEQGLELGLPDVPEQEARPSEPELLPLEPAEGPEPGVLERIYQGAQELVRDETAEEALERVEQEAEERLVQAPLQPVVPGQQHGGVLQTPGGEPIRGLGEEIPVQPVEGGEYQQVGGAEHQAEPSPRRPARVEEVAEQRDVAEGLQPGAGPVEDVAEEEEEVTEPLARGGPKHRESTRLWTSSDVNSELGLMAAERGRPAGGSREQKYRVVNNTSKEIYNLQPGEGAWVEGAGIYQGEPSLRIRSGRGDRGVSRILFKRMDKLVADGTLIFEKH